MQCLLHSIVVALCFASCCTNAANGNEMTITLDIDSVGSKFLTTKLAHLCYFNFAHMRDISVDVGCRRNIKKEIKSDDILSEITSTCYEIGILV